MKLLACLLAFVIPSAVAHAGDDKADSLTLLPWSDTSFAIGDQDHRAVIQYTQLSHDGLGVHVKASAPLDEDTHIAAFTSDNKLSPGFAANVAIGLDTRARRLAFLEAATRDVAEAVKQLSSVMPVVNFENTLVVYAADIHQPSADSGAVYVELCKRERGQAAPCTVDQATEVLPALCAKYLSGTCVDVASFIAVAEGYWGLHCLAPSDDVALHLACVIAGPIRHSFEMEAYAKALDRVVGNPNVIAKIWKIYSYLAPKDAGACAKPAKACILENASEIAEAIAEFVERAPLERRDILMFALQDHADFAALFSASMAYDRASVYQSDIASRARDEAQYDVQAGADLTWYTLTPGLSANFRLGYERSRSLNARTFQRCVAQTSTDTNVSGSVCNPKALVRTSAIPDAQSSVYARAAVDYQFKTTIDKDTLVPGVELRAGFDNVGNGSAFTARISLFATPVKGTTAARVGVAVDLHHDLDADADAPSWIVTPIVFIGATFNDLMGQGI